MTDRLLVFSDPRVQELLQQEFVAVTGDDWYQRRREDEVGRFFREVVEQSPRKGNHTKQGHYVFTAGGQFLGFNNNRGPERRLAMMREALEKWREVRASESDLEIPARRDDDDRYHPELPEGGVIVKIHTRCLEEREGKLQRLPGDRPGHLAAVDHLWLRAPEVAELAKIIEGGGGDFPEQVGLRVAKFHLRDNTRGEPRIWKKEERESWELKLDDRGRVTGKFRLRSPDDKLGYRGTITGQIEIAEGTLTRFDWLVVGDHWGESRYTRGARPGRTPLGQVFRFSEGEEARDRIPPQGIRWAPGYWEPGR